MLIPYQYCGLSPDCDSTAPLSTLALTVVVVGGAMFKFQMVTRHNFTEI